MPHVRVFRCPRCGEFIATDATNCRFCATPIDIRAAAEAADNQEIENKRYRRKQYARHIFIGAGLFLLGVFITLGTLAAAVSSERGGHYVITFGLILSGAGDFIYGVAGYLSELK